MFRSVFLKIILMPLSLLYGLVVSAVHFFYNVGLLKSSRFSIPVIGIGNLSIGGAGKTPHVEYLIDLLNPYINIATLSRGYMRETKGFRIVNHQDTAKTVGDEPLQYFRKFKGIVVAVGESRAYAIPSIIGKYPNIQTILLDDAFQHRTVQPSINILLTAYDDLFTKDYLLPSGRLREWRSGYKRADIIIVTKCPNTLSNDKAGDITKEIDPIRNQSVYFSYYEYSLPYYFMDNNKKLHIDEDTNIILLSAIANTSYLMSYLYTQADSIHEIEYEDHHVFDRRDIEKITKVYQQYKNKNCILLTTEKDSMRLEPFYEYFYNNNIDLYVLSVKVKFLFDGDTIFNNQIRQFLLNFEA